MFNEENPWSSEDDDSIEILLHRYEKLKQGDKSSFLDEEEYEFVIEYYFQNNNEVEAIAACDMALSYFPTSVAILFSKAEVLFQAQKYGQAIQTLDELDLVDNKNLDAVLLRSDILQSQFRYEQAADLLETSLLLFEEKDQIELMLELSEIYDELEEFEEVYDILQQILEINPRVEEALHKISFWADFADMHDKSVALHKNIIDEDPYNALAWFNLGAAYQGLKQFDEAIDAYEYCVAIDEKFEFAYRNMADAHIKLHNYSRAIESLEKNLELGKPEDVIFEAIGHCFEKQKNFDKARYYYRQAIQLNPADDSIFYRIGETYSREREWEKAIKAYSVALNLNTENAAYSLAIGNCLMEMGAYSEALSCFANAIRIKPNNKSNWVASIKCLYKMELYKDAVELIEDAKEIIGTKPDWDFYLAAVLLATGKSKEAIIHLENGLEVAPSKIKILTELNADALQRKAVASLVSKYKRKK